MIYTLDASVILKWFMPEEGTPEAIEFKNKHEAGEITIVSPDLMIYEVANVLRFKNGFPENVINESMDSILALRPELFSPSNPIVTKAVHFSCKTSLSVYDCFYLALASKLNCPLVTADRKIYDNSRFLQVSVELLQ